MTILGKKAKLIATYGPDRLKLYSYNLNGMFMVSLVDEESKIDNLIWYGQDIGSGNILGWDGTHFDHPIFKVHVDMIEKHALEAFKRAAV